MTDPISHALALAHAARRGRDDGGPVDGFSTPLTDDDRNIADASRLPPFAYDDFGRPISAPISSEAWKATQPVGKGQSFFDALDVAGTGEANRPANSPGMLQRGTLAAGEAPTQRDILRDALMGDKPTYERANFVSGLNDLFGLTPAGAASDALDAAKRNDVVQTALNAVGAIPVGGGAAHAIFAGPMAKTADRAALEVAQRMAAEGADRRAIWDATGWFTGPDSKWRFEIPDNQSVFVPKGLEQKTAGLPGGGSINYRAGDIGDMLPHGVLYDAYPEMRNIGVGETFYKDSRGTYHEAIPSLGAPESIGLDSSILDRGDRSTPLHELQHAVQAREGFARGANSDHPEMSRIANPDVDVYRSAVQSDPEMIEFMKLKDSPDYQRELADNNDFWTREWQPILNSYEREAYGGDRSRYEALKPQIDKLFADYNEVARDKYPTMTRIDELANSLRSRGIPRQAPREMLDPFEAYRRTAGEVEARNVQSRMNMTPEERRAIPPWETQDVPDAEQIVRYGANGPQASLSPDEVSLALAKAREILPKADPRIMWHGSPSGDLRGGTSGLHLGTFDAAKQALDARIGIPAQGNWEGTSKYGDTMLAGRNRLLEIDPRGYNRSGYNIDAPVENYIPMRELKYANGDVMPMDVTPAVLPYRIIGPMKNSFYSPMDDARANGVMQGLLKRGQARNGLYYRNIGEDAGSVSAALPGPDHVEPIDLERLLRFGEYAKGGAVETAKAILASA